MNKKRTTHYKNNLHFSILAVSIAILFINACKKNSSDSSTQPSQQTDSSFTKGADISWLTQLEASNYKFYNSNGNQQDCMQILKGLGINAVRLRAWVTPTDGWCNTNDVVEKAIRAKNRGMKIMIDFHYSDSWADPGKQTKPVAW